VYVCVCARVCVCVVGIYGQSVRLGAAIAGELSAQDDCLLVYPLARRPTGLYCRGGLYVAVCFSVLQCDAVYRSVLQRVAVCCSVLRGMFPHKTVAGVFILWQHARQVEVLKS